MFDESDLGESESEFEESEESVLGELTESVLDEALWLPVPSEEESAKAVPAPTTVNDSAATPAATAAIKRRLVIVLVTLRRLQADHIWITETIVDAMRCPKTGACKGYPIGWLPE